MILKCRSCHHEAQDTKERDCDWCGGWMGQIASDYLDDPEWFTKRLREALKNRRGKQVAPLPS